DLLGERPVARDDLAHLLLDCREILDRKWLVAEEVVIEAVVDHRSDGDLRAGPERLHGFGEQMCGIMADEFEGARVRTLDERVPRVFRYRSGQVGERAVERHRDGALGERGRDALGDVETGCT